MTEDEKTTGGKDWNKLAQDALDLWQNHLNGLANDPKMKEDMARMVAPMGQMFNQWTSMMQQNMAAFMATAPAESDPTEAAPSEGTEAASADMTPQQTEVEPPHDAATQEPAQDTDDVSVAVAVQPAPVAVAVQPVSGQSEQALPSAPDVGEQPSVVQPAARGRAASTDGPRDLAQLASRLAQLERELDSLRPSSKRAAGAESASDAADAGDVQRVAGANKGSNTP